MRCVSYRLGHRTKHNNLAEHSLGAIRADSGNLDWRACCYKQLDIVDNEKNESEKIKNLKNTSRHCRQKKKIHDEKRKSVLKYILTKITKISELRKDAVRHVEKLCKNINECKITNNTENT